MGVLYATVESFESSIWASWPPRKCHSWISAKESAATRIHYDIFREKWFPKHHLWFLFNVHADSAKMWCMTGGTVLDARRRTCQTLKIWVHHPTVGSGVLGNEIEKNATGHPQEVSFFKGLYVVFDLETIGLSKIGTISSNFLQKFWHLTGLVSITAGFTLWCNPLKIFLQLSHSWQVFQMVMWQIVKNFWWLGNILSCFWKTS